MEQSLISSSVPAITVTLNHLCRYLFYTVTISFGVREGGSEDECVSQQTSTATMSPGESAVFIVNVSALTLGHNQQYCFTVRDLDSDIEGGKSTHIFGQLMVWCSLRYQCSYIVLLVVIRRWQSVNWCCSRHLNHHHSTSQLFSGCGCRHVSLMVHLEKMF